MNPLLEQIDDLLPKNLENDEIVAMAVAYLALRDFPRDTQHRMLHWINDRLTADFQEKARADRNTPPF